MHRCRSKFRIADDVLRTEGAWTIHGANVDSMSCGVFRDELRDRYPNEFAHTLIGKG